MKTGYDLENDAKIRNLEAHEIESEYNMNNKNKEYAQAKVFIAQNLSTSDVMAIGNTSTSETTGMEKQTEMTSNLPKKTTNEYETYED